jgi:hypothetical protein
MMDDAPELLDQLMADGFTLAAFMLEVSLHLARGQSDPQAWARQFVSKLHERMDANEQKMPDAQRYPVHELARGRIDMLGRHLAQLLQLPPQ